MAAKSSLRVGQKVSFGRAGERPKSGTVKKLNPKTARIKSGSSEYDVTYRLINAKARAGRTKAKSGKGRRGVSDARRDAHLRWLEREWEQMETLPTKSWRSNPKKKKKMTAAKRDALLRELEREWERVAALPVQSWRSNPGRRKRNAKGQFVRTRRR